MWRFYKKGWMEFKEVERDYCFFSRHGRKKKRKDDNFEY